VNNVVRNESTTDAINKLKKSVQNLENFEKVNDTYVKGLLQTIKGTGLFSHGVADLIGDIELFVKKIKDNLAKYKTANGDEKKEVLDATHSLLTHLFAQKDSLKKKLEKEEKAAMELYDANQLFVERVRSKELFDMYHAHLQAIGKTLTVEENEILLKGIEV